MGRLRLKVFDARGEETLKGALENAARLELEIGHSGSPAALRVRSGTGALLSVVALTAGGGAELRTARWADWPEGRDVVDRLTLVIKMPEALDQPTRAEFANVDQISVYMPRDESHRWEVALIAGADRPIAHSLQSVFTIVPPSNQGENG
jgi:hypothetical protein